MAVPNWRQKISRIAASPAAPLIEIALLTVWALWVGRAFLNLDPRVIPGGREFLSAIQAHDLWTRVQLCGACALWDGSERGGFPAFVDTWGSSLHPLVIITTWFFGVINGAKLSLVASILLGGIAQWWLAREMGLGWLARLWSALLGMVSGHLVGRLENGNFAIVLSTAMVALTLAPSLWLARTGSRRAMVALGVVLALVALAGQGYLQVSMLLTLPAYLILIVGSPLSGRALLSKFVGAAEIGVLLASPFLVPLVHFLPNFVKEADPNFGTGQPLQYYLLNLLIDDRAFMSTEVLGKYPFPYLYNMFLGWIPVCLAVLSLALIRPKNQRSLLFLAAYAAVGLLAGSTLLFKWLVPFIPPLAGLRFASFVGGMALPALIGLAACTLDHLYKRDWHRFTFNVGIEGRMLALPEDFRSVVLIPLIVVSLWQGYNFSQLWFGTARLGDDIFTTLQALRTPDLQWVEPPYGEHQYTETAVGMELKLSPGILPYTWKGRQPPLPVLQMERNGDPPGMVRQGEVDGIPIYAATDGREYASIAYADGSRTVCAAQGIGGAIDVTCDAKAAGILTVLENDWNGWRADVDGKPRALYDENWLTIPVSAGKQTIHFRYQPWDVQVGLFMAIIGVAWCVFLLVSNRDPLVLLGLTRSKAPVPG